MRRFEIGIKEHECYNELLYVNINDKTYTTEVLTEDTIALLTALSYVDKKDLYLIETYENLAAIIGFETVVNGLNRIHELGYDLIPHYQLRRMIMKMYKNKYNGLMR